MTESGIYYIFDGNLASTPMLQKILWLIPFYDALYGYAESYSKQHELFMCDLNYLDKIIEFSVNFPIKRELIGHHWLHLRGTIDSTTLTTNLTWIR